MFILDHKYNQKQNDSTRDWDLCQNLPVIVDFKQQWNGFFWTHPIITANYSAFFVSSFLFIFLLESVNESSSTKRSNLSRGSDLKGVRIKELVELFVKLLKLASQIVYIILVWFIHILV